MPAIIISQRVIRAAIGRIRRGSADSEIARPGVGCLHAEACSRPQCALSLQRMVVGTVAIRNKRRCSQLWIGHKVVFREATRWNGGEARSQTITTVAKQSPVVDTGQRLDAGCHK